jgi:hypothetical protein
VSVVGAVALALVLLVLLVLGVVAVVRLVAGAIDDAVALPTRGRHRHPEAARSTRKEAARAGAAT